MRTAIRRDPTAMLYEPAICKATPCDSLVVVRCHRMLGPWVVVNVVLRTSISLRKKVKLMTQTNQGGSYDTKHVFIYTFSGLPNARSKDSSTWYTASSID